MIKLIFIFIFIFLFIIYLYKNNNKHYYRLKSTEHFDLDNVYNNIDIIYYINLDYRIDRKESFLNEMKKINFPENKIKRFSAIKHERGEIGCSQSHINILREFINSNHNNCIIFEDDFVFNNNIDIKTIKNNLKLFFDNNIDYDVVMLAGVISNYKYTNHKFLIKIDNAQTTSGYMISKKFAKKLLDNYIEGEELLRTHNRDYYKFYAIDQYWKKLQENNKWYMFNPIFGKQIESYSDIEKRFTNYNI